MSLRFHYCHWLRDACLQGIHERENIYNAFFWVHFSIIHVHILTYNYMHMILQYHPNDAMHVPLDPRCTFGRFWRFLHNFFWDGPLGGPMRLQRVALKFLSGGDKISARQCCPKVAICHVKSLLYLTWIRVHLEQSDMFRTNS